MAAIFTSMLYVRFDVHSQKESHYISFNTWMRWFLRLFKNLF